MYNEHRLVQGKGNDSYLILNGILLSHEWGPVFLHTVGPPFGWVGPDPKPLSTLQ